MKLFLTFTTLALYSSVSFAEPFSIGAILPLTGDSALGGQACLNGMLLAQRKINSINANAINVVSENNESSSAKTIGSYRKLRAHNNIQATIVWEDSAGHALAPITERENVLLMVTGVDKTIVENRKNAFLYWLMLDTETQAIVSEIKRRGYKKLARVVTQHPGPLLMKAEFDRLNDGRLAFVSDEEVLPDTRDFKSHFSKIKAHGDIDAVVAFLWSGQIGLFAKQMKGAGLTSTIIGSDIYEDENELKLADGALDGAWFPQIADPLPAFRAEYEAAFPGASIYSAGNCYDIVMLIAEALKRNEPPSRFIATVKEFPGALGPVTASGDHRFIFPVLIREVVAGKFRTARR